GAELALEVVGHAEDAAVDAHVLPEDEDVRVALHLLEEREVEGLDHGQLRHGAHRRLIRCPRIGIALGGGSGAGAPSAASRAASSSRCAARCGGISAYTWVEAASGSGGGADSEPLPATARYSST